MDRQDALKRVDEHHEALRSHYALLGIFASRDAQTAARWVIHYTYALRAAAESGQADEGAREAVYRSVIDAIQDFQSQIRRQLKVPNADEKVDASLFQTGIAQDTP